jgi:hypothetical protein
VIVATAHDGKPHTAVIAENGQSFAYTIPDGAIATFVLPAPRPTIAHLRVPRRIRPHTTLRATFTLAENATVRTTLQRILPHHRRRSLVVMTFAGTEGPNTASFSGRRSRTRLAPGRYRLTLTATDAGGDSDAQSVLVTAAPRRRA